MEEWRGVDVVESTTEIGLLPFLMRNKSLQLSLSRYGLVKNHLLDFMHISQRVLLSQPTERIALMAKPLLSQLDVDATALRIGIHMRLGDTHIGTAAFKEIRYPDGCDEAPISSSFHHRTPCRPSVTYNTLFVRHGRAGGPR